MGTATVCLWENSVDQLELAESCAIFKSTVCTFQEEKLLALTAESVINFV